MIDVSVKRQYIIPTIPGTSISYGAISSGGSTTIINNVSTNADVTKAYVDGSLALKTDFIYSVKQDASIALKTDFTYSIKQDASIALKANTANPILTGVILSTDTAGEYGMYTSKSNNHLAQNAYYDGAWKSYGSDAVYGGAILFQTSGGAGGAGNALKIMVDTAISAPDEALSFATIFNVDMAGNTIVKGKVNTDYIDSSLAYVSGFAGAGYQLKNTGGEVTLELDNLKVRKKLSAYELEINEINSIGGGLIVSVANGIPYSVVGTRFYFDTDGNANPIQFAVNDYVKAQQWTGDASGNYLGVVTNVVQSATLGSAYIDATTVSGTPWSKMKLVQVGNSGTAARQNLIYITAADINNPYIEGYAGITAGVFTDATRKFRLGNLTGITDATLSPSGYGLYAQNVFLSGKIVATSGSFSGMASFGTDAIAGDNLILEGSDISNRSHDSDDATIYINYKGYNGLYTRFRNFIVGSGKAGTGLLIYAQGTPKRVGIATDAAPDSTFQVGTTNGAGLKINYNAAGTNFIYGTLTGDNTFTATDFIMSSDERLKTNIQPISNIPIDINYKQFELKSNPGQIRYGIIAQELYKVAPELVHEDKEGMLSVSYIDLLIKEVAYLKYKVKELEGRIK